MKSKAKENNTNTDIKYPCLMIDTCNQIVLFTKERNGTFVSELHEKNSKDIGFHSNDWLMEFFKPFNGTITLSND